MAFAIIWVSGKIDISFTPHNILESLRLRVSSALLVALLLSNYYHLTNLLFFADSYPDPILEEEEALHIVTFNSLPEKQRDFITLITTANLQNYNFYRNGAALLRNTQRQNTILDTGL